MDDTLKIGRQSLIALYPKIDELQGLATSQLFFPYILIQLPSRVIVLIMASSVDAKLLKSTKFPAEFSQKVDMKKVNVEVMKK